MLHQARSIKTSRGRKLSQLETFVVGMALS